MASEINCDMCGEVTAAWMLSSRDTGDTAGLCGACLLNAAIAVVGFEHATPDPAEPGPGDEPGTGDDDDQGDEPGDDEQTV